MDPYIPEGQIGIMTVLSGRKRVSFLRFGQIAYLLDF
jgi:hypothetical protein